MRKFHFTDIPEFCEYLSNTYCDVIEDDELNTVSVVAKYDDMKEIVEDLICIGYEIRSIELHDTNVSKYNDEFLCTIYEDRIGVQRMKNENGYLNPEENVTFVLNNCNHKVLDCIYSDVTFEVEICDGDEEETCYCTCHKNPNTDNKISVTVNGKEVTDEKEKIKAIDKAIAEFEFWDDLFRIW